MVYRRTRSETPRLVIDQSLASRRGRRAPPPRATLPTRTHALKKGQSVLTSKDGDIHSLMHTVKIIFYWEDEERARVRRRTGDPPFLCMHTPRQGFHVAPTRT